MEAKKLKNLILIRNCEPQCIAMLAELEPFWTKQKWIKFVVVVIHDESVATAADWHFTGEFGLVTHLSEISQKYFIV